MSAYITQNDILGQISQSSLISALDDDNSGALNTTALNSIITSASAKVDKFLGMVYEVPVSPVPQVVFDAALTIACYMIYRRTKAGKESNPFADDYSDTMDWLKLVSEGKDLGLDQALTRAFAPAMIVGEDISTWGTTA